MRSSMKHKSVVGARPSSGLIELEKKSGEEGEELPLGSDDVNVKGITKFFLGCWDAHHACETIKCIDYLERKRGLKEMQRLYGYWSPPHVISAALERRPAKMTDFSSLPNNKDTRKMRYVLKTHGCSLHENRPLKDFLKAETHRQMKYWLYKYQGPIYRTKEDYTEPICRTRLKRLFHFFPESFTKENDLMYFNGKILTYDKVKSVFYIGRRPENDEETCTIEKIF